MNRRAYRVVAGTVLGVALVVAAWLRLADLGAPGLSACDESFNVLATRAPLAEMFEAIRNSNQLPLGPAVFRLFPGSGGPAPGDARSPAALFGLLSVCAIGFVLRARFALLPAAVGTLAFAVLPTAVLLSRIAREYSLLLLLASILFLGVDRFLRERAGGTPAPPGGHPEGGGTDRTIGVGLLLGGCLLTHFEAVVLPVVLAGLAVLMRAQRAAPVRRFLGEGPQGPGRDVATGRLLRSIGVGLLVAAPWFLYAWFPTASGTWSGPGPEADPSEMRTQGQAVRAALGGAADAGIGLRAATTPLVFFAARDRLDVIDVPRAGGILAGTLFAWFGVVSLFRRARARGAASDWLPLLWFGLPLVIGVALIESLARDPLARARYFVVLLPALAVLVTEGIRAVRRSAATPALIAVMVLSCGFVSVRDRADDEEYRSTGPGVQKLRECVRAEYLALVSPALVAELLVIDPLPRGRYLAWTENPEPGSFRDVPLFGPVARTEEVLAALETAENVLLLYYPFPATGLPERVPGALLRHFERVSEERVGVSTLARFVRAGTSRVGAFSRPAEATTRSTSSRESQRVDPSGRSPSSTTP